MHGCLCRAFAAQDAKEKRGILKELVESSELSELPKRSAAAPSPALRGGACFRRSCCSPPQLAPLGAPRRLWWRGHPGGMSLCRDGASLLVISQHNAAIQSLGKLMSHAELPRPVTSGKHARICSSTLTVPPAQE